MLNRYSLTLNLFMELLIKVLYNGFPDQHCKQQLDAQAAGTVYGAVFLCGMCSLLLCATDRWAVPQDTHSDSLSLLVLPAPCVHQLVVQHLLACLAYVPCECRLGCPAYSGALPEHAPQQQAWTVSPRVPCEPCRYRSFTFHTIQQTLFSHHGCCAVHVIVYINLCALMLRLDCSTAN